MSPTRASATRTLESPDASELLPAESARLLGALGWGPTSGSFRQRRAAERGWHGPTVIPQWCGSTLVSSGHGWFDQEYWRESKQGSGTAFRKAVGPRGAHPLFLQWWGRQRTLGRAQIRRSAAERTQIRRTPWAFDGRANRPGRRIPATAPPVDLS